MKRAKPTPSAERSELDVALTEIDAEIVRLQGLHKKAEADLAAENRKVGHPSATHGREADQAYYSVLRHERLERRASELAKQITDLRNERDEIELRGLAPEPEPTPARIAAKVMDWPIGGAAENAPSGTPEQREHRQFMIEAERFAAELMGGVSEAGRASPISLRYAFTMEAMLVKTLKAVRDKDRAEIEALKARLAAVEATGLKYSGVWQRSNGYQRGAVVTHHGSAWVAISDHAEPQEPGSTAGWQLMVKKGSDGKDAAR